MGRPATSGVSALSGFVAKWSPGRAPRGSPSPSDIPYGGSSPRYGSKPDFDRRLRPRRYGANLQAAGRPPGRVPS